MNFTDRLTETNKSFGCFKEVFKTCNSSEKYNEGTSIHGRLANFGYLVLSIISIPATIITRIIKVAAHALNFLASLTSLLQLIDYKTDFIERSFVSLVDSAANLVTSPLTLIADRLRLVAGIIHPGAVYTVYPSAFYF